MIALHGFTQRGASFEELEQYLEVPVTAPDLPGHGEVPVSGWEETVASVAEMAAGRPEPPVLAGYSMGGRIALGSAVHAPQAFSGLILISASPGIAAAQERARRRAADAALAARIERIGVAAFVDEWLAKPMFAGLGARPEGWRAEDRRRRSTNRAAGLAGALRRLGQGSQPDLRSRLRELQVPVLVIVGERDDRYRALAAEMATAMPGAETAVVRDAGHPVVGERPHTVAEAVLAWFGE
jgi:2-succinyl-6-hydroxy-2,4-cyclohexadiene-1-carboxylate synthase